MLKSNTSYSTKLPKFHNLGRGGGGRSGLSQHLWVSPLWFSALHFTVIVVNHVFSMQCFYYLHTKRSVKIFNNLDANGGCSRNYSEHLQNYG